MSKKFSVIRSLFLIFLIAIFATCASTPRHQSTGEYFDDSMITAKVKVRLANDQFLKSFQIGIESVNGVVRLHGFVDSQLAVDKAGAIASGVEGAKSVRNDLVVK